MEELVITGPGQHKIFVRVRGGTASGHRYKRAIVPKKEVICTVVFKKEQGAVQLFFPHNYLIDLNILLHSAY